MYYNLIFFGLCGDDEVSFCVMCVVRIQLTGGN